MKFLKWLDDKLEETFLIITIAASVLIIFAQVIMRYVFSNSLSWSEELARYLFLYQIWIGAAYAVKRTAHLRIEIIPSKLTGRPAILFDSLALIVWLGFSIFLASKSITLTNFIFNRGQLSPAMRVPMGYAYLSVPVGVSLMCLRLVQQLYLNFKKYLSWTDEEVAGL